MHKKKRRRFEVPIAEPTKTTPDFFQCGQLTTISPTKHFQQRVMAQANEEFVNIYVLNFPPLDQWTKILKKHSLNNFHKRNKSFFVALIFKVSQIFHFFVSRTSTPAATRPSLVQLMAETTICNYATGWFQSTGARIFLRRCREKLRQVLKANKNSDKNIKILAPPNQYDKLLAASTSAIWKELLYRK